MSTGLERRLGVGKDHVVIDKEDYKEVLGILLESGRYTDEPIKKPGPMI